MIVQANAVEWANEYDGPLFHALLCDPPYHLTSITDRFGKPGAAPAQHGTDGAFGRVSKGFMGRDWDGGDVAFRPETWAAFGRVLHPGAFGMAFASTRGFHRMAVAIEDAGFIIHPVIMCWAFGSGFPKATRLDVQIDRAAGVDPLVIGSKKHQPKFAAADFGYREKDNGFNSKDRATFDLTSGATPLAQAWGGHRYGSQALKPAFEPLLTFRKPLNENPFCAIIGQITVLLEGLSCTLLPAPAAEPITNHLHQTLKAAVDNFVHQSAGNWVLLERVKIAGDHSASSLANLTLQSFVAGPAPTPAAMRLLVQTIQAGLGESSSLKDTATYDATANTLESIAWLWSELLDALSNPQSMFTTATAEHLTTDLKILRSLIEQSIHAATMLPSNQHGLLSCVHTVAMSLQSLIAKLPLLNSTTATANAIAPLAETATDQAGNLPSLSPIIVFQKPYQGRPIDCITRTGAGAINIDAGRIGRAADDRFEYGVDGDEPAVNQIYGVFPPIAYNPHEGGRWPSNLILSHHPECNGHCVELCPVRRLGEQSGESEAKATMRGLQLVGAHGGILEGARVKEGSNTVRGHDDSGTAARYFYNADWMAERLEDSDPVLYYPKASTAEREAGLEDFPAITVDDGREKSIDNAYQRGETTRRNMHPTIKNISLTRHLATLLLPPAEYGPRRLFVPFAGVASEMIGAMLAGWEDVEGVELEETHVQIARARLAFWQQMRYKLMNPDAPVKATINRNVPDGQRDMFDE